MSMPNSVFLCLPFRCKGRAAPVYEPLAAVLDALVLADEGLEVDVLAAEGLLVVLLP